MKRKFFIIFFINIFILAFALSGCKDRSAGKAKETANQAGEAAAEPKCAKMSDPAGIIRSMLETGKESDLRVCAERLERLTITESICQTAVLKKDHRALARKIEQAMLDNKVTYNPVSITEMENYTPGLAVFTMPVKSLGHFFQTVSFLKDISRIPEAIWLSSAVMETKTEKEDYLKFTVDLLIPTRMDDSCALEPIPARHLREDLITLGDIGRVMEAVSRAAGDGSWISRIAIKSNQAAARVHFDSEKSWDAFIKAMDAQAFRHQADLDKVCLSQENQAQCRDTYFLFTPSSQISAHRISVPLIKADTGKLTVQFDFQGYNAQEQIKWQDIILKNYAIDIITSEIKTVAENRTQLKIEYKTK